VVNYTNPQGYPELIWLWDYKGVPVKREITIGDKKRIISYSSFVPDQIDKSVDFPSGLAMS
jgi:hypothetical protein